MKKNVLKISLLILLFTHNPLWAQIDIKKYYSSIYHAEDLIMKDSLDEALKYYEIAFTYNPKPWYKDYHNAMICCLKTNQFEKAKQFAIALIGLGVDIYYFQEYSMFTDFRKTQYYDTLLAEYRTERKKYLSRINPELTAEVDYLQHRSMRLVLLYPRNRDFDDSSAHVQQRIATRLVNLISKYGFPNEYSIGLSKTNDTTYYAEDNFSTVMRRVYHKNNNRNSKQYAYDFTAMLLNEFEKGNIHPDMLASLNDESGEYRLEEGFGQEGAVTLIGEKMYFPRHTDIQKINELREKYNLCSLNHLQKKIILANTSEQYHDFILTEIFSGMSRLGGNFTEEEIEDNFQDSNIYFKK